MYFSAYAWWIQHGGQMRVKTRIRPEQLRKSPTNSSVGQAQVPKFLCLRGNRRSSSQDCAAQPVVPVCDNRYTTLLWGPRNSLHAAPEPATLTPGVLGSLCVQTSKQEYVRVQRLP